VASKAYCTKKSRLNKITPKIAPYFDKGIWFETESLRYISHGRWLNMFPIVVWSIMFNALLGTE